MLRNLGFFLGSVYALAFPFREPKKAFVALTLAKCVLLLMLVLLQWAGEHSAAYCCVLMLGIGFLKLQHSLIFYILSNSRIT